MVNHSVYIIYVTYIERGVQVIEYICTYTVYILVICDGQLKKKTHDRKSTTPSTNYIHIYYNRYLHAFSSVRFIIYYSILSARAANIICRRAHSPAPSLLLRSSRDSFNAHYTPDDV